MSKELADQFAAHAATRAEARVDEQAALIAAIKGGKSDWSKWVLFAVAIAASGWGVTEYILKTNTAAASDHAALAAESAGSLIAHDKSDAAHGGEIGRAKEDRIKLDRVFEFILKGDK